MKIRHILILYIEIIKEIIFVLTLARDIEAVVHAICHVNINSPWWHVHWQVARCNFILVRL